MNLFSKISAAFFLVLFLSVAVYGGDAPRFEVVDYQVAGSSIIPEFEVKQLLAPFTGRECDFGTLQQAVEALEKAFKSRGYHAVRVQLPEQELKGGVVRIAVSETRIGTVVIEGNKNFDERNIRSAIPSLLENAVPNLDQISKNIRVANENPARKIQLLLQNGDDGKSLNAQLKVVDEKPWKIGMTLDDTGNNQTGSLRMGFSLQHANLFNRDHLATFQYTTSPEKIDRVNIFSFGYRIPLYKLGDSIDLFGGYSDVDSGAVQSGILSLNVSGKGIFTGVRYNQNLTRIGSYEHRILYGFDYRRFDNTVDFAGISLGNSTEVTPLSIGYSGSYVFGRGSEISGWASISQNIPGGDKGETADYRMARANSFAEYTILRAGATGVYKMPADFQARFTAAGQFSWMPLIPGEQFGMGGQGSIRGFGERELADDIGLAGSMEIYTPNLFEYCRIPKSNLRALAFYDAGYLERNRPQPGEEGFRNAASTGVGLRLAIDRYLSASTDYAIVVGPLGRHNSGSARWHFKLNVMF